MATENNDLARIMATENNDPATIMATENNDPATIMATEDNDLASLRHVKSDPIHERPPHYAGLGQAEFEDTITRNSR